MNNGVITSISQLLCCNMKYTVLYLQCVFTTKSVQYQYGAVTPGTVHVHRIMHCKLLQNEQLQIWILNNALSELYSTEQNSGSE